MRFKTGSLVLVLAVAIGRCGLWQQEDGVERGELRHHDDHRGCDHQLGRQRSR